ncbi:MAG: phosphate ABC transporter permease subunit PstC [Bdellovibrio sp.]
MESARKPSAQASARRPLEYFPPTKSLKFRKKKEALIETLLFFTAASSVLITLSIVWLLVSEALPFFQNVSLLDFLTGTEWTPVFAEPKFGIAPLVSGTLMTTIVALSVAIPFGSISAIFLSQYCSNRWREILKPILELLAAVPTVVYGYFAVMTVTPLLQKIFPELGGFSILSAGLVMGLMIVPYIASLTEDALRSVPSSLREASMALGATRLQTSFRVLFPSALSGITAAYVLGVSRALGETMVVAIAAGMNPNFTLNPLHPAATLTAFIVQISLGDVPHGSIGYQSIYVAGLVLLMMTLVFNILGLSLRRRFRESL